MPTAITPRRRSRDELESDEVGSASPDMIPSSQPDFGCSSKRARLTNRNATPSSNGTPLTNGYHLQSDVLQKEVLRTKGAPKQHQPGAIVRVTLANFVTYTAVDFYPGPSLNMVIGPNGTGKSTLVCAICLGLGWGPQVRSTTSKSEPTGLTSGSTSVGRKKSQNTSSMGVKKLLSRLSLQKMGGNSKRTLSYGAQSSVMATSLFTL